MARGGLVGVLHCSVIEATDLAAPLPAKAAAAASSASLSSSSSPSSSSSSPFSSSSSTSSSLFKDVEGKLREKMKLRSKPPPQLEVAVHLSLQLGPCVWRTSTLSCRACRRAAALWARSSSSR